MITFLIRLIFAPALILMAVILGASIVIRAVAAERAARKKKGK